MSTYTIYRLADGRIVSYYSGPAHALKINTPAGHGAIEGAFDARSFVIDVEQRKAVPQMRADYEADAREQRRALALAHIQELEKRQHRAMRELVLGAESAKDRLAALDAEIASLRAEL